MSSRSQILKTLRSRSLPAVEQPRLDHQRQTFDDLKLHFGDVLKTVGGEAVTVAKSAEIDIELSKLASYATAKRVVSLVPGVGQANVDSATLDRPHELEDIDYAILPGRFGVAENAAVWLDLRPAKHRGICVLAQHLAIVVPAKEIVPTMHEAYSKIAAYSSGETVGSSYGLFLSGPSKTADIEQSLVIGAHGARSLTVFLVEEI